LYYETEFKSSCFEPTFSTFLKNFQLFLKISIFVEKHSVFSCPFALCSDFFFSRVLSFPSRLLGDNLGDNSIYI